MTLIHRRHARRLALTAAVAAVTAFALAPASQATPRAPASRLATVRTVTLPGPARLLQGWAQANATRHQFYFRRLDKVVWVDTRSGTLTTVANVRADEGMLLNRTSGDLYTFNAADPKRVTGGLSIVSGSTVVKHPGYAVATGINLGGSRVALINEPNDPEQQAYLLEYDGARRVGKTPVCNGLPPAMAQGDALLGYNSRTGLLYVACGEWLPHHKFPYQQIFRGTTLIETLNRHINADYVRVDAARNITYVVGSRRMEVIKGTHVAGIVSLTIGGRFFPGFGDSGIAEGSGDFYLGTAGHGGTVAVYRGTRHLGTASVPAEQLVVNQHTGIAYAEHKEGPVRKIELLNGSHSVGSPITTHAVLISWDAISGDEIATSTNAVIGIRGHHVAQTIAVGPSPHDVFTDAGGHRLYTIAGTKLTIVRT